MRCIRVHRARRFIPCIAAFVAIGSATRKANAQQVYPPPTYPVYPQTYPQQYPYPQSQPVVGAPQPGTIPKYNAPLIILAAPVEGASVPEDKPVAVLRFMSVEPTDPIDALSFSVSVDGHDKTGLFQLTQGEAWGSLAKPNETLAAGQHDVAARICTSHGECGTTKATVTVVAPTASLQASAIRAADKTKEKKSKVLDAVLQAARVLIR